MTGASLAALDAAVVQCRRCPRLVAWREEVARERRAAFADQEYWGRPVPGFGDDTPRLLVVGLAPAAHGANRTGRMFTGDRSGEWLYRALHRAGFADRPHSADRQDGLRLQGVRITAAVRCAPPGNRPTPAERDRCGAFLDQEVGLSLPTLAGIVALGAIGWDAALRALRQAGYRIPTPKPRFGHGAEVELEPGGDARGEAGGGELGHLEPGRVEEAPPGEGRSVVLLGSYHPSQQNTFTGRLTEEMFDAVWARARVLVGDGPA